MSTPSFPGFNILSNLKINSPPTAEYEDWKSECQAASRDLAKRDLAIEIYKGCDSKDVNCTAAIRGGEFARDLNLDLVRRCTGSHGGCQLTFHHNGINSDEFLGRRASKGLLVAEYKVVQTLQTDETSCTCI